MNLKQILVNFFIQVSTIPIAPFLCPTPDGSFKHEVCTMYWHCYMGTPNEFNCPSGLSWNDHLKTCDSNTIANCHN
jgi:hypothetical protein